MNKLPFICTHTTPLLLQHLILKRLFNSLEVNINIKFMEDSASLDKNVDLAKKKPAGSKKDSAKVRRKFYKAEREKLKRDNLNELFQDLTKALEPATQNGGKSSALTATIRILSDLMAQVDSLKKENAVLLAESQYVAVEKDELKEENIAMESQIIKLQNQLNERVHSRSLWNSECSPVLVVPIQNDPKLYAEPTITGSNVSKPHARYPLPSDSWPIQILSEQPIRD